MCHKLPCDACGELFGDAELNCAGPRRLRVPGLEEKQDADERTDNGRNTGGKSYF